MRYLILYLKIAALEYRSNFTIVMQNNLHIGFELGSDISSNLDLDDYFVFDKNPDSITAIFAGILSKHIKSELPEGYLDKIKVNINTASNKLFIF